MKINKKSMYSNKSLHRMSYVTAIAEFWHHTGGFLKNLSYLPENLG